MSNISINVEFDGQQEDFQVLPNQNVFQNLINITDDEVFAVCFDDDNKIVIPTDKSLIAKLSSVSKTGIFYLEKEIISSLADPTVPTDPILKIKLKKISKLFNHYSFYLPYFLFPFCRFRHQRIPKRKVQEGFSRNFMHFDQR